MVGAAQQRAQRRWQIQTYLAEVGVERRRSARRAAALFVLGAVLAQLAALLMTDRPHFLGFTVLALGQIVGAGIGLRAAPAARARRRRRGRWARSRDP